MRRVRVSSAGRASLSLLGVLAALCVGGIDPASATSKKVRKSQPASAARSAPDVTATIAAPKLETDQGEALPTPFNLPQAPRTRMRSCGERWQTIKLAGQAKDQTWREFATKCLAQSDGIRPQPR